jgi:hypothetical protein
VSRKAARPTCAEMRAILHYTKKCISQVYMDAGVTGLTLERPASSN